MNWLEVIHLRTTVAETDPFLTVMQQLVVEAEKEGSCREIKMYRRALVDTDVSLTLDHDTLMMEKNGSSLGLRIAAALKEFGMVNHTVWSEMDRT